MEEKKKSLKMPIIATIVIIVILLIIGGVFYLNSRQNPKNIFMSAINSGLKALAEEKEDIKTVNANISLGVKVENLQDEEMAQMVEYLNKTKLNYNVQMDVEQEKESMKLGLEYDNENVLEGQLYYKNRDENAYVFINELFDKYFSIELDETSKEQIANIFELAKQMLLGDNGNDKKVAEILKDAIEARLKDEYITQEDAEVDINGTKVKTKKSVLKFNQKQLLDELSTMISELKNNEEFINGFSEDDKETVRNGLEQLEKYLNDIKSSEEDEENGVVQFNIYTKGLQSKFVKMELVASYEDDNMVASILKDENNYNLFATQTIDGETEELCNCTVTITKIDNKTNEYTIKTTIDGIGDVTVILQLSCVYNEDIENIDTTNSVNIEDISEEDQQKMIENLQKMKIYDLVKEIIGVDPLLMLSAMQQQ